jgi:DNA ligase (NAD+)
MTYIGEEIEIDENFKDKTFVLTGSLSVLTRNDASLEIEKRGGKTTSSVTKKTDYVIVGENPGSKYDKAKELNINILTEEEFVNLINFSKK